MVTLHALGVWWGRSVGHMVRVQWLGLVVWWLGGYSGAWCERKRKVWCHESMVEFGALWKYMVGVIFSWYIGYHVCDVCMVKVGCCGEGGV